MAIIIFVEVCVYIKENNIAIYDACHGSWLPVILP